MRQAYAHDAVLIMSPDGDTRAPGGAITVELCGRIDHEPPCPLAPHHTHAERAGDEVRLRILFATEPGRSGRVRLGIDRALRAGAFAGPDGTTTSWRLRESRPGAITPAERDHATRLTNPAS
jgi:hypothetical protein